MSISHCINHLEKYLLYVIFIENHLNFICKVILKQYFFSPDLRCVFTEKISNSFFKDAINLFVLCFLFFRNLLQY